MPTRNVTQEEFFRIVHRILPLLPEEKATELAVRVSHWSEEVQWERLVTFVTNNTFFDPRDDNSVKIYSLLGRTV